MADEQKPKVSYDYPQALVQSPQPPAGCRKIGDQYVTMRDGVRLCVDIYLPDGQDGPFPTLLSLSPYSKDIQRKPPQWSHAIESGATNALSGAIERMLRFMEQAGQERPLALVSGGAAHIVAAQLNGTVEVVDNLVLEGLVRIALDGK